MTSTTSSSVRAASFVVESKFCAEGWALDPPDSRVLAGVAQAERNARSVRLWMARELNGIPVRSVAYLWGGLRPGSSRAAAEPLCIGDTVVVHGRTAAAAFRESLVVGSEVLSADGIDRVWRKLSDFIAARERHPDVAAPISLDRIVANVLATIVTFTATLLGTLRLASTPELRWYLPAAVAALLVIALLARRSRLLRIPAIGSCQHSGSSRSSLRSEQF